VIAGWKGRKVKRDKLLTIGVLSCVVASTGDKMGDHKGHRVLYGGRAAQYWDCAERVKINEQMEIMKHIKIILLFDMISPFIFHEK